MVVNIPVPNQLGNAISVGLLDPSVGEELVLEFVLQST